ncbi:MAG: hydrogenase maturation protease, partial [Thiobacillus sp.]|nr:hydrogenase maturation protease [Thiobacillus sp.]
MKILILGIGNTLLSDEGVGVHVIQAMAKDISPDDEEIVLVDGGTLSFTLAGPIGEAESLVVVDAAEIGQAPGSLQVYEGEAVDRFL